MSAQDRRWRGLIAGGAVLSFLAMVASLIVGGRLAGPRATGIDSYSKGPLGHKVAYKMLDELGYGITRQHTPYHHTDVALFLEPATSIKSTAYGEVFLRDVLDERTELALASIIVLPKWRMGFDGEVSAASLELVQLANVVVPGTQLVWRNTGDPSAEVVRYEERGPLGEFVVELPWRQSIVTPEGFESLLGPEDDSLVVMSQDQTRVIVSDPDLFHNFNVQRGDHALLIDALLHASIQGDAVALDEVFHGHAETPSLGQLLSSFPAVLLVVQGVALCLLVVLFGYRRYGVPQTQAIQWERGPLETVEVSAGVLSIGESPASIAVEYVKRAIADSAERLGLKGKNLRERATRVDEVLTERGLTPTAVSTLREARGLGQSTRRPAASLRVAQEAYELRLKLLHENPSKKQGRSR